MRLRVGMVRCVAGSATVGALAAAAAGGTPLASAARHANRPAVVSGFPVLRGPPSRVAAAPFGGYTPAPIRGAYFLNPPLPKGIKRARRSTRVGRGLRR